jgi:protein tyrosine/serine phosphatase
VRRSLKITGLALLLPMLILGGYIGYILTTGNFHPITPGEAYRSAQLDRDELVYYIKKFNIRSIVNLRGENRNRPWYIEEAGVSAEFNVAHYDISLSASGEPSDEDVKRLMEIFKFAPRPVLIHCQAGADRSGLVAAMWKVVVDKEPKSEAKKELSLFYGHIPIGNTVAMDRFFEKWTSEQYRQ